MTPRRLQLLSAALLAASAALDLVSAPWDGADKAPGAPYSYAELKPQFTYSVVAPRTEDSPRSDSASIAELAGGSLLIVWQTFRASPEYGSDFGHADITSKISRDDGKTWGDERRIIEFGPGDKNIQCPAITVLPNGELLLAALRVHEKSSSSMCLFRSKDQGLTWQDESRHLP